jgi:hypothetical protein
MQNYPPTPRMAPNFRTRFAFFYIRELHRGLTPRGASRNALMRARAQTELPK